MTKKDSKTLFLHYGPGGNAQVERQWYGDKFKGTDFWDQPTIHDPVIPYQKLIDACEDRARVLTDDNTTNLSLWGHSFGCNLALELAAKGDLRIKELILCSPLSNIPVGFRNLAQRLNNDPLTSADLKKELSVQINKFDMNPTLHTLLMWDLVGVIGKDPHFSRLYWSSQSYFQKYISLASKAAPLDLKMWAGILQDYVQNFRKMPQPKKGIAIQIFIGKEDPYIELNTEKTFWQKLLPEAEVKVLNGAGHFCHLEASEKINQN